MLKSIGLVTLLSSATAVAQFAPPPDKPSYHDNVGALKYVNPLIGTRGGQPNDNGGMIPSVSPPFGMTRWTPQTRENFISQVPYSDHDRRMHGFQATHQPAIWMGESGQMVLTPGWGDVKADFTQRGLGFRKKDERAECYIYEVLLDAESGDGGEKLTEKWAADNAEGMCPPCPGGESSPPETVMEGANGRILKRDLGLDNGLLMHASNDSNADYDKAIRVAMSASAHAGHIRFHFEKNNKKGGVPKSEPWVHLQASRLNWTGHVHIDPKRNEVSGSNTQRQDWALGPDRAESFRGYFVSRFSEPFISYGVSKGGELENGTASIDGKDVGGYVKFRSSVRRVEVRTGVSFVSVEQARRNLDLEIPDGQTFEVTVANVKAAWKEKINRITISGNNNTNAAGANHDQKTIFYSAMFHALQYPNDYSEPLNSTRGGQRTYYSGYTDSVHKGNDSYYQSWSIWDTFRAEHSLLTIFAPERVNPMMRSLLKIYDWSGRLPIWANMVETNIMIATNADAVLANALARGFNDFNVSKAWEAVRDDAYTPPENDTGLLYYDRQPFTPHEARAGLTSYMDKGWVANDRWAESASRTLDYAFNDYAAAVVARHAGKDEAAEALLKRSQNYKHIWNSERQFMQARNDNGTWADPSWGWTEGDEWVYTFDVMHDVAGLASLFEGGREGLKKKLDEHFAGGHNLHSNEPSHHVPYLYSAAGYPWLAAEQVRSIARENYNATASGLSGNEDLGQMSAWYVFSALGFYPVDPAGDEYVVGSPFFDEVRLELPRGPEGTQEGGRLVIKAPGAGSQKGKMYVAGLKVDGREVHRPLLKHADIVGANVIEFEMSHEPTDWGTEGTI
ncbi:hypothetical protein N3K66_000326 [Trichothecium roseum]|uniref:Uncharacterized protein n=1 Tax=Trichothecium roseum TaxID=47278 RepID=A0ACC0VBN3_9HYPO|nr:hypothetical protein N3K66_000326 [Trichothecium roseum]